MRGIFIIFTRTSRHKLKSAGVCPKIGSAAGMWRPTRSNTTIEKSGVSSIAFALANVDMDVSATTTGSSSLSSWNCGVTMKSGARSSTRSSLRSTIFQNE